METFKISYKGYHLRFLCNTASQLNSSHIYPIIKIPVWLRIVYTDEPKHYDNSMGDVNIVDHLLTVWVD